MNKFNIIKLSTVDSTNEYLLSLRESNIFSEGLVVVSDYQTHGKGQYDNKWLSNKGKNLLVSVLLEPKININYQFDICKLASLSIVDLLNSIHIDSKVKWPNDIIVNNQKISGILINNLIKKNTLIYSVIGFGLNVNQLLFDNCCIDPTSIFLQTKHKFKIDYILEKLLVHLNKNEVLLNNRDQLDQKYVNKLYNKDIVSEYQSNGVKFKGTIIGIDDLGLLMIRKEDNLVYKFNAKEIKTIIK